MDEGDAFDEEDKGLGNYPLIPLDLDTTSLGAILAFFKHNM